ncbi:MAG: zf-HC2 domain-containing protein [Vicinamibacterales bacterium]
MNANREPICGDPAALVGYLYGECSPDEQAALSAHLATCEQCRTDIDALQETREVLAAWAVPSGVPGVRVAVEPPHTFPSRGWNWSAVPVWAQAAAAVFIFACGAAGAAVMNLDVRYDAAGLTVRTGWGARPAAAPALDAAVDARIRAVVHAAAQQASAEASRPVRSTAADAVAGGSTPTATGAQPAAAEDVLRRVEQMLAASETRQQRELALRVSQVLRDVDSQHRSDMARIERTVSPVAGLTAEEIQEQRQMLNYLMRVSQTK